MTHYRFLDEMGDVVDERVFSERAEALHWAATQQELDEEITRVEYLGEGQWRWAGALEIE